MKNVLFIAYRFDPYPGVGSKRITYWATNCLQHGLKPIVITATENPTSIEGGEVMYVPDPGREGLLIKDEGKSWYPALKKAVADLSTPVDVAIITGGPFMHMAIAKDCRRELGCKVILDFRDPFAIIPRFDQSKIRVWVKRQWERSFCKAADVVLTVNQYCADLLETGNTPVHIIDNGYDERLIPAPLPVEPKTFVYTGSFFPDRDPGKMLEVLRGLPEEVHFIHVGTPYEGNTMFRAWDRFEEKGLIPYADAMELLSKAEVATLVVSGEPFESTTKVFDYLAMNKKILVVANRPLVEGALFNILKDYPNKVICDNNVESIDRAAKKILSMTSQPYDAEQWSRKRGLEKLVELIRNIA